MQTIKITTSQNIDIDYEVAGLGERILARLIDYGIFIVILIAGLILYGVLHIADGRVTMFIELIIYGCLYVFYDLLCEIFMNGQSIGKKVMKIKVISLNGARPSISQYLMRWLFRIVDFSLTFNLCGLICAAVSDKSQRVGDMVAGTGLIRTSPRTKTNNIAFMPEPEGYISVFKEAEQLNDRDIELIHEVINNYVKTRNSVVVYNMAVKIRELLKIQLPPGMNDMQFLQTMIKDYNYISAHADIL